VDKPDLEGRLNMRRRAHKSRIALLAWLTAGGAAGHLASLCAQELPPSFTLQPTGAVVQAGQSLQLVAEVAADPAPALQWQFNGADVPGETGSILNLNLPHTNRSGIYRLQASNSLGVAYSDDALVTVLPVYPEILVQPTNTTVFEGDTLVLRVQLRATPGVGTYLQWRKDGIPLRQEFPVVQGVTSPTLQMLYVGLTNSGGYDVVVSGDYGVVTSEVATVTVVAGLTNAGWVDGSFDTESGFSEIVKALAIQPDGKVLAGGVSRIVRLNSDGSLDDSFSVSNAINGEVLAIALQPDGKILVGGAFSLVGTQASSRLARLNADGTVDSSFTMNPSLTVPNIGGETVASILVQDDGRILHAGSAYWLGRRLANGSLDSTYLSFIQVYSGGSRNDPIPARGLTMDRDGKLLLVGSPILGLRRFHANGTRDTSFNQPSTFTTGGTSFPDLRAVAAFPDGRILIGGSFSQIRDTPRQSLACLNSDGSLSSTFAVVLTNSFAAVNAIARLPDGKVMIAGVFTAISGVPTLAGLARLNADGSLDTSFDTSRPIRNSSVMTLATRPAGGVLAGGNFSRFGGFLRGGLVQLHGDAAQPLQLQPSLPGKPWKRGREPRCSSKPHPSLRLTINGGSMALRLLAGRTKSSLCLISEWKIPAIIPSWRATRLVQ
jgi:uncharacterized delta-60 repeat protein